MWKSQVSQLSELRDKDFYINQSRSSGWRTQEGIVRWAQCQLDSIHPDLSARWVLCQLDSIHPDLSSSACGFVPQAFVIAITSDFIPRLVYQYSYSHNGTLHGFVNHTLSFFNVSQLKEGTQPENSQFDQDVQFCR